jgi:sirohydrochlorin cobaltochelatase
LHTGKTWAKHSGVGEFDDASLVLFGHGSTVNPDTAAPVLQHAQELASRRVFAEVRHAFWKQQPFLTDVLAKIETRRAFFVPFFISEGFFTQDMIPRALGFREASGVERVRRLNGRTLVYTKPVGTHGSMTRVLLDRAQQVVRQFPFPRLPCERDLTLFIAGHGTEQNEKSRAAIESQVQQLGEMNRYAAVHAIFLEEEPRIPACYALSETRGIVVVPFFISDGMHVREDIPVLLGEPKRIVEERIRQAVPTWRNPTEKHGKLVWYSSGVGSDPLMSEVIMDRVRESAASAP